MSSGMTHDKASDKASDIAPDTVTLGGADIAEAPFEGLSWFSQERVAEARVLVAGCGALGNEVLKNLALFGVGHVVIVDFDVVEPSNLCRSVLFTRDDTARRRYKVDAARERLLAINPAMSVTAVCGDLAHDVGLGLLRRMDVAIGCVDSRYARYCLNRLCMRAGIPWVDGGIDRLEGTARVFMPGRNCYACSLGPEGLRELSRRMPCSAAIRKNEAAGRVPTTPVIASVIGAVQVQEALKLIHRPLVAEGTFTSLTGKMFYYEGQHLTTRLLAFEAYDDCCPDHDCWTPVRPTSLTHAMTVAEALSSLSATLGMEHPQIVLRDTCFVDYIVDRQDETRRYTVMCPAHRVAAAMESRDDLREYPAARFYQHELPVLDAAFPYPDLTLSQTGIPAHDILRVRDGEREVFAEIQ